MFISESLSGDVHSLRLSVCVSLPVSVSLFLSLSLSSLLLCALAPASLPQRHSHGDSWEQRGLTSWVPLHGGCANMPTETCSLSTDTDTVQIPHPPPPPGPGLLVWPCLSSPPSSYLYYILPMPTHRCPHSASCTGGPWILTVEEGRQPAAVSWKPALTNPPSMMLPPYKLTDDATSTSKDVTLGSQGNKTETRLALQLCLSSDQATTV